MARPEYITDEFYKTVQKELEKYSKDHDAIMERTRMLDDLKKEIDYINDESYNLLKTFGPM